MAVAPGCIFDVAERLQFPVGRDVGDFGKIRQLFYGACGQIYGFCIEVIEL
jgi:hypothetical protein